MEVLSQSRNRLLNLRVGYIKFQGKGENRRNRRTWNTAERLCYATYINGKHNAAGFRLNGRRCCCNSSVASNQSSQHSSEFLFFWKTSEQSFVYLVATFHKKVFLLNLKKKLKRDNKSRHTNTTHLN